MTRKKSCELTWYSPAITERPTSIMQAVLEATTRLYKRLGGRPGDATPRRIAVFDVITAQGTDRPLPPSRDRLPSLDVLAVRQVKPARVTRESVTYIGDVIDFLIHTARKLSAQKHVMSFKDASRFFTCARYGEDTLTSVLRVGVFIVRADGESDPNYFLDYSI